MMKRLSWIVLLAVVLLLPEGIYAERPGMISFIVDPLAFTNLGNTSFKIEYQNDRRIIRISTTGLVGEGTINCSGNDNCTAAGLDDEKFDIIRQDLQLELRQFDKDSTIENDLRGRTMGLLSWQRGESPNPFKGRVKGFASAAHFDSDGEVDGMDVTMDVSAKTKGGGKVEQQLHGKIVRLGGDDQWGFSELEGRNVSADGLGN